jgi:hypothetical protein
MADISTAEDWDPGEQVTDTKLDNILGSAIILPAFVTGKTELVTPVGTEVFPVVDVGGAWKKVQLANIPGAATQPNPTYVTLADAAPVLQTCNPNKVYQNAKYTFATFNRTLQIDSSADGMFGSILVTQDSVGGRVLTLPASSFGLGQGPISVADLSANANDVTLCSWTKVGSSFYWTFAKMAVATPFARAYITGAHTLTSGTPWIAALDGETHDNDGMHSTVTNNSRITAQRPGIYLVTAFARFTSNAAGLRVIDILFDGAGTIATQNNVNTGGTTGDVSTSFIYSVNKADYFEMQVNQTSGGNLSVTNAVLTVARIGAF